METERQQKSVVKCEGLSRQICNNLIQSSLPKAACNITVGVYGKSNNEICDLLQQ